MLHELYDLQIRSSLYLTISNIVIDMYLIEAPILQRNHFRNKRYTWLSGITKRTVQQRLNLDMCISRDKENLWRTKANNHEHQKVWWFSQAKSSPVSDYNRLSVNHESGCNSFVKFKVKIQLLINATPLFSHLLRTVFLVWKNSSWIS